VGNTTLKENKMSMDVIIWATCALNIPADLPEAHKWKTHSLESSTYWSYQAPNFEWQLVVEDPNDMPIPDSIKQLDPNIKIAYALTLEPIGAPIEGHQLQQSSVLAILRKCNGALVQDFEGLKKLDSQGNAQHES
jgi:hypothetical protein